MKATINYLHGSHEKYQELLRTLRRLTLGERYIINIKKLRRKRSNNQNNYWWGVIVPAVADYMGEADHQYVHEILLSKFCATVMQLPNDETVIIYKRTSDMDTEEMSTLIDKVIRWLGSYGISVDNT